MQPRRPQDVRSISDFQPPEIQDDMLVSLKHQICGHWVQPWWDTNANVLSKVILSGADFPLLGPDWTFHRSRSPWYQGGVFSSGAISQSVFHPDSPGNLYHSRVINTGIYAGFPPPPHQQQISYLQPYLMEEKLLSFLWSSCQLPFGRQQLSAFAI